MTENMAAYLLSLTVYMICFMLCSISVAVKNKHFPPNRVVYETLSYLRFGVLLNLSQDLEGRRTLEKKSCKWKEC